jgi:UDP-N-acetylglucosamine 2-epimerase (non-hydrolysing)
MRVVRDVNSIMACTIVDKKLWIDVCHVEAGLHSFNMKMVDEINRMVIDAICDPLNYHHRKAGHGDGGIE